MVGSLSGTAQRSVESIHMQVQVIQGGTQRRKSGLPEHLLCAKHCVFYAI